MQILKYNKLAKRLARNFAILALALALPIQAQAFSLPSLGSVTSTLSAIRDSRLVSNYVAPAFNACTTALSMTGEVISSSLESVYYLTDLAIVTPVRYLINRLFQQSDSSREMRGGWFEYQARPIKNSFAAYLSSGQESASALRMFLEDASKTNEGREILDGLLNKMIAASIEIINMNNSREPHPTDSINIYQMISDEQRRRILIGKLCSSCEGTTIEDADLLETLYQAAELANKSSEMNQNQAMFNIVKAFATVPIQKHINDDFIVRYIDCIEQYIDCLAPAVFQAAYSGSQILNAPNIKNIIKGEAQIENIIKFLKEEEENQPDNVPVEADDLGLTLDGRLNKVQDKGSDEDVPVEADDLGLTLDGRLNKVQDKGSDEDVPVEADDLELTRGERPNKVQDKGSDEDVPVEADDLELTRGERLNKVQDKGSDEDVPVEADLDEPSTRSNNVQYEWSDEDVPVESDSDE